MAAFDYERPRTTALRLIARFGGPAVLRSFVKSGPTHDPTLTPVDQGVTVAVIEYAKNEVDGKRILASDRKALMAGSFPEPSATDELWIGATLVNGQKVGGVRHAIVDPIDILKPADVAVLYTIQVRK